MISFQGRSYECLCVCLTKPDRSSAACVLHRAIGDSADTTLEEVTLHEGVLSFAGLASSLSLGHAEFACEVGPSDSIVQHGRSITTTTMQVQGRPGIVVFFNLPEPPAHEAVDHLVQIVSEWWNSIQAQHSSASRDDIVSPSRQS